jgi:hypothetical protein
MRHHAGNISRGICAGVNVRTGYVSAMACDASISWRQIQPLPAAKSPGAAFGDHAPLANRCD